MADDNPSVTPIQSGILDPLVGAGFFSPNMSLEEIKRRRAIAGALASRARPYPKTIGEGMTYFGESLVSALDDLQLGKAEKAYNARRDADMPGAVPVAAPVPRPVAEAPPDVVPPPVATTAAPPSMAPRPSPAPVYKPTMPLAGVDPLTVEPASGPASRDAIARGIMARNGAVPPGPMVSPVSPTVGAAPAGAVPDGASFAEEGGPNPPIVTRDIKPMRVAEAAGPRPTAPPFGLRGPDVSVRNPITRPPEPEMEPAGAQERAWEAYRQKYSTDEDVARKAERAIAPYKQKREQDYSEKRKEWELKYTDFLKQQADERAYERDLPKSQQEMAKQQFELAEAQKKAALKDRLGGREVEDFYKEFKIEHTDATKMAGALGTIKEAEDAIRAGAITGYGSNARLNAAKIEAWLLNNGKPGGPANVAAQTEILKSQLDSMIGMAVANIQPGDPRVSDADLKMASGQTGNIEQQREAILRILSIAREKAHNKIDAFEERRHKRIGGTPLEDDFQLTTKPTADPRYIDALIKNNTEADRQEFDRRFGAGAAALEINRAKRRGR